MYPWRESLLAPANASDTAVLYRALEDATNESLGGQNTKQEGIIQIVTPEETERRSTSRHTRLGDQSDFSSNLTFVFGKVEKSFDHRPPTSTTDKVLRTPRLRCYDTREYSMVILKASSLPHLPSGPGLWRTLVANRESERRYER